MNIKRLEVFFEFLVFGVVMGTFEDALALRLASGEPLTWKTIGIIVAVTIPFAALGELVVDRIKFFKR